MKRDLKRKSSAPHWRILGIAVLALSLAGGAGWVTYQHRERAEQYMAQAKTWLAERRSHLRDNLSKVKKIAADNNADQEVHFEFYTALPTMQVQVSAADTEENGHTTKILAPPVKSAKLKSGVISSVDDLVADIEKHVRPVGYVVQLGVFRDQESANAYRQLLLSQGTATAIVKTGTDEKIFYRVQQGPFSTKERAMLAQQQVQKKGLNGLIRELTER